MASPEDALLGYFARGSQDAQLKALLGVEADGAARIEEGFPSFPSGPEAYPRHTFFSVSEEEIRPGFHRVRIQTDTLVWPEGASGGGQRRKEIDDRLLELFSEQHWTYNGAVLYAVTVSGRSLPGAVDAPLRKIRDFVIHVSPAS